MREKRAPALIAATLWAGAAAAQAPDVPQVISPLRIEADRNNVNLVSGRTTIEPPSLAVPGAPNLRYDRVQNAAPYALGKIAGGETPVGSWSVHTGQGSSESFRCADWQDCASVTGTGSTFRAPAGAGTNGVYRQAGTGAVWQFNQPSVSSGQTRQAYASTISYPNGEVITYAYQTAVAGPFGQTLYRPTRISSSLGYHVTIAYRSDDAQSPGWGEPGEAAIYNDASPDAPLGRLTYNADWTVTDLGGRIHACTGCNNALGTDLETAQGSRRLPGEDVLALQVAQASPSLPLVGSVMREGVSWSYSYLNPRLNGTTWLYDRVTVTGPDGSSQVYTVGQVGLGAQQRNVLARMADSLGRTTDVQFDEAYRPVRVTYPQGNAVRVLYDDRGNIVERRAYARPGTELADLVETALYPDAPAGMPNLCTVTCWRATWSRDALNRQTDYAYNAAGQLTEQIDPADSNGVRRRTSTLYALSPHGISRRSTVRVCADAGATCGANSPIQTRYDYPPDSDLLLPSAERRIDVARNLTLTTLYTYDLAGRLLSTDGPMPGDSDTSHNRYDLHGRLAGTIGADPDGAGALPRLAVRNSYDGADRLVRVETGTLAALPPAEVAPADWTGFTIARTLETAYEPGSGRKTRDTVREGAAGAIRALTQYSYDSEGRLECRALRMNPASYGSLPASACTAGPAGSDGPDRIAKSVYDAAGQRLQLREGVGTADEAAEASWEYSANGQVSAVIDGNGNRAELHYDGHGRQDRWTFPSASGPAGSVNPNDYEAYGYDAAGNRTSLRKRDGSVLTYEYDALDRLIVKHVPERAGLTPAQTRDVHYGYDLRGLPLYARFDGPTGPGIANAYDAFGRLATATADTDGTARTLAYKYDAASLRARIIHPDLAWFETSRDTLGRPYWLASSDNHSCFYGSWRPDGLPSSQSRCNGASTWVSRDGIGRLDGLGQYYGRGGAGDVLWLYQHNPASQIRTVARDNDGYAWTGHYAVNRAYATNGLNQYVTAGGGSFTYDANGNLASEPAPGGGVRTYTYDVENRLVGSSAGVTLAYDPLGRLYQVTASNGTVTRFLYDGDALVGEYNAAGEMTRRYAHWEGADVPVIAYSGATLANPSYLHPDHQGSIVAISDATGVTQINRYDEYGIPAAANAGRFQYTGQIWLAELGLYYYKARLYSPTLGRFWQVDPIGYDDQFNLYEYVGDDPVNRTDPTGMCEFYCPASYTNTWADQATRQVEARVSNDIGRSLYEGSGLSDAEDAVRNLANGDLSGVGRSLRNAAVNVATRGLGRAAQRITRVARPEIRARSVYQRPSGATTRAQRASVQGRPCVHCQDVTERQVAGHRTALVQEHYETGTIDRDRMRHLDAVQPECPTCSAREGADMSRYSRRMRRRLDEPN